MISYGAEDPHWIARHLIIHSPALWVRKAVLDLMDEAYNSQCVDGFEILDRLIQVSATGFYKESQRDHEEEHVVAEFGLNTDGTISEDLTPEQEQMLKKFRDMLNEQPSADDPFKNWKLEDEDD